MTVYHPLVPGEEIGSDGSAAHFIAARTITGFEICFNRCSGWPVETARIELVCQLRKTQQQLNKYIFAHDVVFAEEEELLHSLPKEFCTSSLYNSLLRRKTTLNTGRVALQA